MKYKKLASFFSIITLVQANSIAQEAPIPMAKNSNIVSSPNDSILSDNFGGEGVLHYNKGHNYLHGKGVQQSNSEARKWFSLAAKSNSAGARYKIGRLYETGVLYKQNIQEAVYHYEFAAQKGDIYALNNLAILYLQGNGVKQDINKGISLARKAALKGNEQAQVNLGLIYLNGTGVAPNQKQALSWFKEAAKQRNPDALYYIAQYHISKKEFIEAFDYLEQAAQSEHADSQFKLAMLYGKGLGIEQNNEKSLMWLNESAKLGNKQAIIILKKIKK